MNRADFARALELTSRALAANDMIPILMCFAFYKGTVMASNDTLCIVAPCEANEAFVVDGKTLLGLVTNCLKDEIEAVISGKEVLFKTGGSTFKLPYYPIEDYLFSEPDEKWHVSLPINGELLMAFEACLMTSSNDDSQRAFMGVSLNEGNTLYSCDGDALTRAKLSSTPVKGAPPYMMPNEFCESVIKLTTATKADSGTIQISKEWAKATLDSGYSIYGRLIALSDPLDYEGHIAKTVKGQPVFIPKPKGFELALARARVLADPESTKTTMTVEADRLKFYTETHMGVVREAMLFKGHPAVEAEVSAALVARAAGVCDDFAIFENCCVFRSGNRLFHLLSNLT